MSRPELEISAEYDLGNRDEQRCARKNGLIFGAGTDRPRDKRLESSFVFLRSLAVIVPKQAANPFAALDLPLRLADFLTWINDAVFEALVIPLGMIMFQELPNSSAQHTLTEEDHSFQRFFLDTPHESFNVWRQIWRSWRKPHAFNAFILQDLPKRISEFRVTIHDQISLAK